MSYRSVEVLCESANAEVVEALLKDCNVIRWWQASNDEKHNGYRMIVHQTELQGVLDHLRETVYRLPGGHIIVQDVEALYPEPQDGKTEDTLTFFGGLTREELLADMEQGTQLNLNYLVLLTLSTIVAAIGLHEGDLAIVIGAMVIAPLLQSHIALSLGVTVGNVPLIKKAMRINVVGFVLVLLLSYGIGIFWPNGDDGWSQVLLDRASIEYSHLVLALAAGAAAVLSITTGVSSAMVGVMVAVALLPPLTACGLLAGQGDWVQAQDALWLAVANVLCINIAAKAVFQLKCIKPGWDGQKKSARYSLIISYLLTGSMLMGIIAIIYRSGLKPESFPTLGF